MPPKKAPAAKAAAPKTKAAVTKKAPAATKVKATVTTTKTAAATKKSAPAATAASKKRKVVESEPESETETEVSDAPAEPKAKRAKTTAAAPAAAPKKAAAAPKKTAAAPKKTAAGAAATKKAAALAKKTTVAAAKKTTVASKKTAAAAMKHDESDKENAVSAKPKANTKRKRAQDVVADEDVELLDEEETSAELAAQAVQEASPPRKRAVKAARAAPVRRVARKVINKAPGTPLDIFVFGEGSSGELGLGAMKVDGKKPIDVKRPRLNKDLLGVVQIATGGMHCVALTKVNEILTWGVNDQGALGRDTAWEGGLRDADAEDSEDEDEDDSGLNPKESTPSLIDDKDIDIGTVFVQVAASDSASFALTDTGLVYGWGTFRASDGILGFTSDTLVQRTPILLKDLKNIVQLAAGANHVLAIDKAGKVYSWGCGQQDQLARKVFEREVKGSLRPQGIGNLPIRGAKPAMVACGSYHSFVVDTQGRVFAWGLNNFGETGISEGAGQDNATLLKPKLVSSLAGYKIRHIAGGGHHSLACTEDGKVLTWGRIDGHQVGLPVEAFNEDNAVYDEHKRPRILTVPTVLPDLPKVAFVEAGTDHCFAVTENGKAYSWGFGANYQTGQGTTDDVELPTLIDNTAVRERKIVFAGAGGQYSVLASPMEGEE